MGSVLLLFLVPSLTAVLLQTPAARPEPPRNYRPQLVEAVPVPGTEPDEVQVLWDDRGDPEATMPQGCAPDEVATIMVRFFAAWSEGDTGGMQRYLAPSPDAAGTPMSDWERADAGYLAWFGINPIPGGIADGSGAGGVTVDEVLDAAAARHGHGEIIQVLQIAYGPVGQPERVGVTFDLARDADDIPPHIVGGKGEIDCRDGRITVLSASDHAPVVPDAWFDGVEPIRVSVGG